MKKNLINIDELDLELISRAMINSSAILRINSRFHDIEKNIKDILENVRIGLFCVIDKTLEVELSKKVPLKYLQLELIAEKMFKAANKALEKHMKEILKDIRDAFK